MVSSAGAAKPALADPAARRSASSHGPKGAARRDAILDAAEQVFSEHGYSGSSMREVSARCGAALGLINHYFPSKAILFSAVVARRLPTLHRVVAESLEEALRTRPGDARAIIRAFIEPFLHAVVDDRHQLKTYTRMTSLIMGSYRIPEVTPALATLKTVSDLLADALRPTLPHLSDQQFGIAVYLIEAALIFMVQDTGFLDSLSSGHFGAERIDLLLEPAATLFAAGSAALAPAPSGCDSRTIVRAQR